MRPTLAELARRQQISQMGVDTFAREAAGMSAKMLEGHLRIASSILRNDMSPLRNARVRQWLYAQAEASGKSRQEVDGVIRRVLDAPSPEAAVRSYAQALSPDPTAAEQGLELARHYHREHISEQVGNRLHRGDQQAERSGTVFKLPDSERLAQEREQVGSLRRAIETSLVTSGVAAPRPRTLADFQARAQSYANAAADKLESLESRRAQGQQPSLREDIEGAWMADRALRAKDDAGIESGGASIGEVVERADAQMSVGASIAEDVENRL